MTRRWRRAAAPVFACLVAAALAGCGNPPHGPRVEVAAVWTGAEQKAFGEVLAAFERSRGARVRYTPAGDDIAAVLGARIQGGDPPDVAILPQPGLMTDLARRGALKSIQQVAGAEVEGEYAPIWRELGTVGGTLYGVWFKAANKSMVWYNVPVFRNAGVRPPTTWTEMLRMATIVSDSGTASSEQVRQPIYTQSIHRWRRYAHHLDELIDVLRPVLPRYSRYESIHAA